MTLQYYTGLCSPPLHAITLPLSYVCVCSWMCLCLHVCVCVCFEKHLPHVWACVRACMCTRVELVCFRRCVWQDFFTLMNKRMCEMPGALHPCVTVTNTYLSTSGMSNHILRKYIPSIDCCLLAWSTSLNMQQHIAALRDCISGSKLVPKKRNLIYPHRD